uniref:Uncharacterized protein n=1 Tax=Parascaris equorum TaxID=6256 RepID=A0A914RRY9_PAREQ
MTTDPRFRSIQTSLDKSHLNERVIKEVGCDELFRSVLPFDRYFVDFLTVKTQKIPQTDASYCLQEETAR